MNELLVGVAGTGKTHLCIERCLAAIDAGREVLYLVPNFAEIVQVRRRLLAAGPRRASLLPGVTHFRGLLSRLLDPALPGWSLRSPLARRLHIHRLLLARRGKLGPLEASAPTPGFLDLIDRCFRELEEGGLAAEDLSALADRTGRSADRRRLQQLAELFGQFQRDQAASTRLDEAQAMRRAAAVLTERNGASLPVLSGESLLILDGFSNLNPAQLALVEALLPHTGGALISLCLDPADLADPEENVAPEAAVRPPFEPLDALARRFAHRPDWRLLPLAPPRRYGSDALGEVAARLFRALPRHADSGPSLALGQIGLLEGATRRDELDGILRALRDRLAEGERPDRIAILYRDEDYAESLARRLTGEGIPFSLDLRRPLLQQPLVDLALAMLDWAASQPEAARLPERLRGGAFASDNALLAELASEVRARGIADADSLTRLLHGARRRDPAGPWDWLSWRDALPDGKLGGDVWLSEVLMPLVDLLLPAIDHRLQRALTEEANETPQGALADFQVLEAFAETARAVIVESRQTGEERLSHWIALLRLGLRGQALATMSGTEGGGVHMGDPRYTRLPEVDTVFVCGLNQGRFPPRFREDGLLREAERGGLNRALVEQDRLARVPVWRGRQAEDRYLFYIAATRASKQLVLSWSQRDRDGRPQARSHYLDELENLLGKLPEPVSVPALSLEAKLRRPLNLRALARDTLFAGGRKSTPPLAQEAEVWLRRQGLGGVLDAARRGREEVPLEESAAVAAHLSSLTRFSASRLEAYAQCPYRFLMEKLLGLEEEAQFDPGAREEGLVYHKTLELFYRNGGVEAGMGEDSALRDRLAACYRQALNWLIEKRGENSLESRRFRAEDPRRLALLFAFLREDLRRQAESGFVPEIASLEQRFAFPSAQLPGVASPGPFTLTGVVDRMDRAPDGARLVLDYKRGDPPTEPPGLPSPRLFQLALYALANDGSQGATYCSLVGAKPFRGYFREALRPSLAPWTVGGARGSSGGGHWLDEAGWNSWLEGVSDRLRELVAAIRAGRFAAEPVDGADSCRFCDFPQLCRWRPEGDASAGGRSPEGEGPKRAPEQAEEVS